MERSKPALANVIVSLPWVADGITLQERAAVGQLVNAAMLDEPVFVAVVDKTWVLDGLNRTELAILQDLTRFTNESVASRIANLPFLETVESADSTTVDLLSDLDLSAPDLLTAIAEMPWAADGIDDLESEAIDWTRNFSDTDVALSVVALAWVQDGFDDLEIEMIEWLSYIANHTSTVASSVVDLGWVRDDVVELEITTIQELYYIAFNDVGLASAVVELGWVGDGVTELEFEGFKWLDNFSNPEVASLIVALQWAQDGIEELEAKTIEQLSYIDHEDRELASTVVALAWVQDGIGELEVKTIEELSNINYDSAELASSVIDLDWVQDGIEEIEFEAIGWANNFSDGAVASLAVALAWVQDGVEEREVNTIEELSYIDFYDTDEASRIVSMPFLETLDPPDVSAVKALSQLASFRETDFQRVLSHPTLSKGITDDWAKIVATLYGVSDTNPELIDILLDPDRVIIEERIIELPLAGETHLAIIRTDPGSERSMDLLQQTVQSAEKTMAMPFPTNYVAVLFEEGAVTEGAGGVNFGTHIGALPTYDKDNDSYESAELAGLLVHEVAHYYWRGNPSWIDEGLANTMGDLPEDAHVDNPVGEIGPPCGYARTIAALEAIPHGQGDDAFTCNYTLGERLFLDLYRNLGESSFREGLRDLYMLSRTVQEDDTEDDAEIGIEHVKTAFKGDEDSENALVDLIAARWYDGTVPYDTSARDAAPPDPRFRTVNGRIDVAYLAATDGGTPTTSFSAQVVDDWAWLFLDYSYSLGSGTREVALELVDYYEDGFAFDRRHVSFTADADFIGGSWWLPVGQSPSKLWAPGEYRLHVYNEGRKLVELEYEVTP